MDKQFFLPLGRLVTCKTTDGVVYTGFFDGMVNFGGVPSLWISDCVDNETIDLILPVTQVVYFRVIKAKHQLIQS
jgi:hypothetical protein